jgi:hypothetical protein
MLMIGTLVRKNLLLWIALALSGFLLTGCGSSDGGGSPTPTPVITVTPTAAPSSQSTLSLSGAVTEATTTKTAPARNGIPGVRTFSARGDALLQGVSVDIQGIPGTETVTDKDGFWQIPVARGSLLALYPDGNIVVNFRKAGYIDFHQVVNIGGSEPSSFTVVLPKAESADVVGGSADLSGDGRVEGLSSDVAEVQFYVGDPVDSDDQRIFPGAFRAVNAYDSEADLVSQTFAELKALDASGNPVSLDGPVKVTLRLPQEYQDGSLKNENGRPYKQGDLIDWWYYDKGAQRWQIEDASPDAYGGAPGITKAQVISQDNALFVQAWVTHFSWWNADYPQTRAKIRVKVVDSGDRPLQGYPVYARGITYANLSSPAVTDADGVAVVNVKKSDVTAFGASGSDRVEVFVKVGDQEILYSPASPDSAGEGIRSGDKFEIYTPNFGETETPISLDLTGNRNAQGKNGIDLGFKGTPIKLAFPGQVSGTVTDHNGKALAGYQVYSNFGSAVTGSDGSYAIRNIYVPATGSTSTRVFVLGADAQTATLTKNAPTATLNFSVTVTDLAPIVDTITQTPGGKVLPGGQMTLQIGARDPEGTALSYAWSIQSSAQGTLVPNATDPSRALWTAPSSDSGTGFITVSVSDAGGKATALTIPVGWSKEPKALKLTCTDDYGNPLGGVYVILHGANGKSIDQVIQTNATGVADFGTVTRDRVTLTLAREETVTTTYVYPSGATRSIPPKILAALKQRASSGKSASSTTIYIYHEIKTVADILPNVYTLHLDGHAYVEDSPDAVLPLTLKGDLRSNFSMQVQPGSFAWGSWSASGDVLGNLNLYDDDRQSDDKVSILANQYLWQEGGGSSLAAYGTALDLAAKSGDAVTVELNKIPVSLDWVSNKATTYLSLSGARKQVWYTLTYQERNEPYGNAGGQTSGTLRTPSATEFPVSSYALSAHGQNVSPDQTIVTVRRRFDSLGSQLPITYADYSFSGVSFDVAASQDRKSVSWTLSGSDAKDIITMEIQGHAYSYDVVSGDTVNTTVTLDWQFALPPTTGSPYVLPDLPPALQSWLTPASPQNSSITVEDYDGIAGYDALIAIYGSGQYPTGKTDLIRTGTYTLIWWQDEASASSAEKSLPERSGKNGGTDPLGDGDRHVSPLRIFLPR